MKSHHHQWYQIALIGKARAPAIQAIREAFEEVIPGGNASKACALFMRETAEATVVFISPGFTEIAPHLLKNFSAVESEAPPRWREVDKVRTAILLAAPGGWSLLD